MASHQDQSSCVQVVVRVRPQSNKESKTDICIRTLPKEEKSNATKSSPQFQTLEIDEKQSSKSFTFDHVFPPPTIQEEFFSTCVDPLVRSCLKGYNATIFAYGQTGSGKTHTMIGNLGRQDDEAGVIPRALEVIFLGLEETAKSQKLQISSPKSITDFNEHCKPPFEYEVKVTFIEVYGEDIHDLIGEEVIDRTQSLRQTSTTKNKSRLHIRDGKVGEDAEVIGACQAKVQSSDEALQYLQRGMKMRRTDHTAMNAESSRSHAIFTLVIQQTQRKGGSQGSSAVEMMTSKTHFVDLAGSERIKSAETTGKRMHEGININKGLFVLGNVISSLGKEVKGKKRFVPYRDSNLTRLLKGSLGGNHKTIMIGCVSPSVSNQLETMSTLRYANRAKNIKNNAKINVDPSSKVINELKDQVKILAMELQRLRRTDKFGDIKCPFSADFLDGLIGAKSIAINRQTSESDLSTKSDEYHEIPEEMARLRVINERNINKVNFCDIDAGRDDDFGDLRTSSANQMMHDVRLEDTTEAFAIRPFSAPAITNKPVPFQITKRGRLNASAQYYDLPEEKGDEIEAVRESIKQAPFYNLLQKSVRDLANLEEEEEEDINVKEGGNGQNQVMKDRRFRMFPRLAWRQSLERCCKGGDNEELAERQDTKKIALYDTMLVSLRNILGGVAEIPNANLDRIMEDYKIGYAALKLESEIKLIESKIKSYRNEKIFLDDIIDQLKKNSLNSVEVFNSVTVTKREIVKLEKELDALLFMNKQMSN